MAARRDTRRRVRSDRPRKTVEFWMHGPLSYAPPGFEREGRLEGVLRGMLGQGNGAAGYGGAFILLPSGACDVCWTMEEVNAGTWKAAYPQEVRDTWYFAVDALGNPFGILGEWVVGLCLETGVTETLNRTLGGFMEAVQADPDVTVHLEPYEEWLALGLPLELRERLVPRVPAMMGGGGDAAAHMTGDLMDVLDYHADLHGQTRDLPDGTRIRFVARD